MCGENRLLPVYHIAADQFEMALGELLKQNNSRFMLQLEPGSAKVRWTGYELAITIEAIII